MFLGTSFLHVVKKNYLNQAWGYILVIPVLWEAEGGALRVQAQPDQLSKALSQNFKKLKITQKEKLPGVCMPCWSLFPEAHLYMESELACIADQGPLYNCVCVVLCVGVLFLFSDQRSPLCHSVGH